jgi:ribosome-associated protein
MSQLDVALNILSDLKLVDQMVYEVKDTQPYHDYIVIATATNSRQLQACLKRFKELDTNDHALLMEGSTSSSWVLVATGDVVVHLFTKEDRDYYDLEKIWFDRPHWSVDVA